MPGTMQWKQLVALAATLLVKAAVSSRHGQNESISVAVDLFLSSVPGQVHNGMYTQVSENAYRRDLPWVNVYFSLQRMPQIKATESVVKWQFQGYECTPDEERRVCTEIAATELESDRDQKQLHNGGAPHIISRQSSLSTDDRRLQFETPTNVAPPVFTTQTAYYSCAYSGGGSNWCCAQSNQGSGGPYCWSLSTCREEYSAWNQQNIICCTASAGDCALTYQPVMPTSTPATTAPTTTAHTTAPATSAPATQDPFADIPILADTTAPATSAPTQSPTTRPATLAPTQAPTTAPTTRPATPAPTQAPTTAPATSAPATQDPFADVPILADTTAPTTRPATLAPTQAPTTAPTTRPATPAPTQAPTTAPVTSAPTQAPTTRPATPAPTQAPTASPAPATEDPFANIPILADTTAPPATQTPSTSAPTQPATTTAPTSSPSTTPPPVTAAPVSTISPTTAPSSQPSTTPPTSRPSTTTTPVITTQPSTTPSTSSPTTTAQPATTSSPTTTSQPSTTSSPTTTTQPSTTSSPAVTSTPIVTIQPSTTSTPATSSQPSVIPSTSTPSTTTQPSTTANPVTTSVPATTAQPSTTTAPTTPADVPILADPTTQPSASTTPAATRTSQPSTGTPAVTASPGTLVPSTGTPVVTATASPVTGNPTTTTIQPTGAPATGTPPDTTQPASSPTPSAGTVSPVTGVPSVSTQPSPSPSTALPSPTATAAPAPTTSDPSTNIPVLADTPIPTAPTSTGAAATTTPGSTSETSTNAPVPGSTTQPPASTTVVGTSTPASSSPQSPSVTSVSDPTTQPTAQPSTTIPTETPTTATPPVLADTQVPAATNPASSAQTPASTTESTTNPAISSPPSTDSSAPTSTPREPRSSSSSSLADMASGSRTNVPPSTATSSSSTGTPPTDSALSDTSGAATSVPSIIRESSAAGDNSAAESGSTGGGSRSSITTSSPALLSGSDAILADSSVANEGKTTSDGSSSMASLSPAAHPLITARGHLEGGDLKNSSSDISPEDGLPRISSAVIGSSSSGSQPNATVSSGNPTTISNARDENRARPGVGDGEAFHRAIIDFTHSLGPARDIASNSANILVATAVTANVVSAVISIATVSTSAVSSVVSGVAGSQGILNIVGGGVAASGLGSTAPAVDLTGLFMMLNYLQFISSSSHLSLPTAPDFFFHFTDSLGWCNFQPTGAGISPYPAGDKGKESLSSENVSIFTVADGDIISGVLAYAERINVKPEELFTKTAIVFVCVVGGVAAVVATLYSLLRLLLRRRLELLIQRLDDLPRAKLLMRLLIQSCLSICLLSEYALSMTSSFQMRYNEQQHHGSHSAFAFATVALTVVCCGLIVLGVVKIWNKSEEELSNPDFKFAWGAYYKYYHFKNRYFFVAKMGAEILSGVIIGLVSDVPSQLTLLMSLQLTMFLYTIESAPYSMEFQTVCSSIAFVMKMVTYALISSFLTPSTEVGLQNFVGTLVIVLQVMLLVLFNSRQLYILYKQMKYLWELRQNRLRTNKENKNETGDAIIVRSSVIALTPVPVSQATPTATGSLENKRNSMTAASAQLPVAAC